LQRLVVSHAVKRRISGGFHEDTAYGLQGEEDGQLIFHYRKRLDATLKQFDDIADPVVQQCVRAHLAVYSNDTKAAFAGEHPCLHIDGKTPIRTVRIRTTFSPASVMARTRDGHAIAHYKLGNNHHLELWREANGKVTGQIVTAWSAAQRVRTDHSPLYPSENGTGRAYLGSLTINDTVEVPGDPPSYVRVQKMSDGKIEMRSISAATLDDKNEHDQKSPAVFFKSGYRKVFVDPLGRVMPDDQTPRRDRPTGTPSPRSPATGGATP
jgi:hypothetical protein